MRITTPVPHFILVLFQSVVCQPIIFSLPLSTYFTNSLPWHNKSICWVRAPIGRVLPRWAPERNWELAGLAIICFSKGPDICSWCPQTDRQKWLLGWYKVGFTNVLQAHNHTSLFIQFGVIPYSLGEINRSNWLEFVF